MNGQSSCGTPQSQTVVVRVVTVLSTKLTRSLTLSTLRMNVKQQRLQSAGFYQVNKLKLRNIFHFTILSLQDLDVAVVIKKFNYKNCCNDEIGMLGED